MVVQSSSLLKSIIVLLCLSLVVDAVAVGRRRGDGCRGRRGPPGRNCQEDSDCGQNMVCCEGSCQPGVRSHGAPVSRRSPTNSCREFNCLGLCSHGWATNTRGCRLGCVCETCPRIDCNLDCEHGYRNDVSVCPVCACNPPPKICEVLNCAERGISCPNYFLFGEDGCQVGCTCFGCPRLDCETLSCPINGFAVDANNCPICECARCPRLECNLNCEHGYRTGVTGCPVCACNPPPGGCELFNCAERGISCPNGFVFGVDGCQLGCGCDGCPRLENCNINCPHGFATDAEDCPICACNPPPGGCEVFNCTERGISCPNGFVFGVDGCQLGCGCDGCPRLENCDISCPHGFATDAESCPICACNPPPGSCEAFNCVERGITCPNGFVFGVDGCQLGCGCDGCPRLENCDISCPHGFATDAESCPICACNPPPRGCEMFNCAERGISCPNGFVFGVDGCQLGCGCDGCPRLECDSLSCPLLGFAVDANNCPICSCNSATYDPENFHPWNTKY